MLNPGLIMQISSELVKYHSNRAELLFDVRPSLAVSDFFKNFSNSSSGSILKKYFKLTLSVWYRCGLCFVAHVIRTRTAHFLFLFFLKLPDAIAFFPFSFIKCVCLTNYLFLSLDQKIEELNKDRTYRVNGSSQMILLLARRLQSVTDVSSSY